MSSTRSEDPGRGDGIDSPAARKYRLFKRLLDRNRDALGSLANLEQAYYGGGVASMADLRARYGGLSKSVHELAADLRELADDKYAALDSVIDGIDREVALRLRLGGSSATGDLVVPLQSLGPEASAFAGGKAAHLATISRVGGVSIPEGFVVTTAGFQCFIRENALEKPIEEALAGVTLESPGTLEAASKAIQATILGAPVPAELASRILSAYDALRRGSTAEVQVAMRSSAVGEDSEASFAGQYTTVLGVGRAAVLDAYRSVIASKYSPGAILYRLRFGLEDGDTPMAALGMVMIDARSSGVMYTRDPFGRDPTVMKIGATWGLGEPLVSGEGQHDVFLLSRETTDVLHREIHAKDQRLVLSGAGGVRLAVVEGGEREGVCVDDDSLRAVARLGLALEGHFGSPQDVEWSLDQEGVLHLLQSRPLNLEVPPKAPPVEPSDASRHPILLRGGTVASPGVASGTVVVVRGGAATDLPEDTILVARAASPDHAVLIGKVKGIVTDIGSATSHLASVAREFGVPAIFNAENATTVLRQGQAVTMLADTTTVYQGIVPEFAGDERPQRKHVFESPMHRRLRDVLDHVAPLNLTDPAHPSFSIAGCRTMHDVIRFVHEQAMREMFGLARRDSGGPRSVKLKAQVPLSLYLIDVGGGLKPGLRKGDPATPDDIQSRPLKALWKGFCHPGISWSGGAAGGGLGDLMRLASAGAMPGVPELGGDSYALVAADYLNLNVKFGYHFAYLDALCSDIPSQNYVSLQFSGGLGSQYGKSLRLTFLGAVLERLGFRVVITGDILDAQLVGHDAASAGDVLDQVARLLASSRLLDMAISHQDRVEPMVEAFFRADYDFLGEGLTQRLPDFYTQDGNWTRVEEDGRTLFVQDGTEWGAGLTSGFTKLMRKVVGGPKYQDFLDNVHAYFHFPKAIAKGSAVTDAALALRVRPMGGVIDQAGGLAFAVRNMANYFALRINALEDNVILFEFVNGRRYQRATVARRIETGRWYSVAAVVRGNSVQGFLDDEPLLEYRADRSLEGYVGMWTKADSLTHFADLRIERRP